MPRGLPGRVGDCPIRLVEGEAHLGSSFSELKPHEHARPQTGSRLSGLHKDAVIAPLRREGLYWPDAVVRRATLDDQDGRKWTYIAGAKCRLAWAKKGDLTFRH